MDKEFDVDVTFEESADEAFIDSLSAAELAQKVSELPHDLIDAARGILIERRTYSDVSQDLGIRQPELVRAIHRAKLLMQD
jgi:DNA-directed RNA polymerase specialized sigma24 family protein